ncbi:MAG: aspartate 1-decarboxylase [Phycisphaerae bacterium]|nr:aspartate 1-decarboxylase [Phycisphaerae bacterium]
MELKLLKSKIHRATVTAANIDYVGSIAIDRDLMDAVGIIANEVVLVANVTNGTRHETYVVPAERGSGEIGVMGAAAHLVSAGDLVIIMAFANLTPDEAQTHQPKVAIVDQNNKITTLTSYHP